MRRIIVALVATIALAGAAASWVLQDARRFLDSPLALTESSYRLMVAPGTSLAQLASQLASDGLLEHPWYLRVYARRAGLAHRIKAGEYDIAQGTTPRELLDKLVKGDIVQYTVTLVEGWTFGQMMEALLRSPALRHELSEHDPATVMAALGEPELHPEGLFFPDTYRYTRGTSELDILRRARKRMQSVLAELWERRSPDLPFEQPYEALILASIVERETALPAERRAIAGVFVRRLRQGMLLQTDPTVIYGLGSRFDGNLRRADLLAETPYNTYRRPGLPPTPIAMPGTASIEAVLDPAPGEDLYFVSKGDGSHHFSVTLEEHNRAVERYQLRRSN